MASLEQIVPAEVFMGGFTLRLHLGEALEAQGRASEAEKLYRDMLAIQEKRYGPVQKDLIETQKKTGDAFRKAAPFC